MTLGKIRVTSGSPGNPLAVDTNDMGISTGTVIRGRRNLKKWVGGLALVSISPI
jgi:hypothetical protein